MKYLLKGTSDTTVVVLDDNDENISLLVTRNFDGYEEKKKEIMGKEMFNLCLRTGYLIPKETARSI